MPPNCALNGHCYVNLIFIQHKTKLLLPLPPSPVPQPVSQATAKEGYGEAQRGQDPSLCHTPGHSLRPERRGDICISGIPCAQAQGTMPVSTSSAPTSPSLPSYFFPFVGSIMTSSNQAARLPAEGSSETGGGGQEDKLGAAPPGNSGLLPEITKQLSHAEALYSKGGIFNHCHCAKTHPPLLLLSGGPGPLGDASHVNWEVNMFPALVLAHDAGPSLLSPPVGPTTELTVQRRRHPPQFWRSPCEHGASCVSRVLSRQMRQLGIISIRRCLMERY